MFWGFYDEELKGVAGYSFQCSKTFLLCSISFLPQKATVQHDI